MYCTNCGAEINNDSQFCANCGTKLTVISKKNENPVPDIPPSRPIPQMPQGNPILYTPPQNQPQPSKKKWYIIPLVIVGIAVFLLIVVVIAKMFVSSSDKATKIGGTNQNSYYIVNDSYADIAYSGSWEYKTAGTGYVNKDQHSTSAGGDSCTYTFTGTRIVWLGVKNVNLGKADVYIDDKFQNTVDQYASTLLLYQTLFVSSALENKAHTIKIVVRNPKDKNSSSKDNITVVDGFTVYSSTRPASKSSKNTSSAQISQTAESEKVNENEINTVGNTPNNITSGGLVAKQGGWIYYISQRDVNDYDGTVYRLYKIRPDGSQRTKLCDDDITVATSAINVVGDWIYYARVSSDESQLCKIKTDGSQKTIIRNDCYQNMTVIGNVIYGVAAHNYLIRLNTDGSGYSYLQENDRGFKTDAVNLRHPYETSLFIDNNTIYYQANKLGERYICSTNLNGTHLQKLTNKIEHEGFSLNISDGYAYWGRNWIYKARLGSTEVTKITDDISGMSYINVYRGWIYYINSKDDNALYRISTDGKQKQRLSKEDNACWLGGIFGDWMYYYERVYNPQTKDDSLLLYKVRLDGTQNQALETPRKD